MSPTDRTDFSICLSEGSILLTWIWADLNWFPAWSNHQTVGFPALEKISCILEFFEERKMGTKQLCQSQNNYLDAMFVLWSEK